MRNALSCALPVLWLGGWISEVERLLRGREETGGTTSQGMMREISCTFSSLQDAGIHGRLGKFLNCASDLQIRRW